MIRIRVRMSADEFAKIQRLSAESGQSINALMREAARRLAESPESKAP